MNERSDDWVEDNPTAAAMEPRGDVWEQTKQRAGRARERTQNFLRQNPVPTIIGAFVAGVAIGFAIRLSSDSEEKITAPIRRVNWSFLSLPFLWPLFKSIKDTYEDSADTVRENVDRYAKPIRKRWKTWLG